ncbi:MAG: GNAT family N-acetyltransferase, partial [Actinomycetes bacterium]
SPGHPGPRVVDHLVEINYLDHFAWGVTTGHRAVGVATSRYVRLREDPTVAELAFGIADEFQSLGLGTLLLGALAWAAAEAGIEHFTAEVLSDNLPMRAVLAKAGAVSEVPSMGTVRVRLQVQDATALVGRHTGDALRRSAREVVTAAGLALVEPG